VIEAQLTDLLARARDEGVVVDPDRVVPLADYVESIVRWSSRVNLVSRRELPVLVAKHVAPSLIPLEGRDPLPPRVLVDIGSGGGLPGVVLAIARPSWPVTLVEPLRRKTLFLTTVTEPFANARVLRMRAEEVAASEPRLAGGADLVTARAVAPPHEIWPMARPLLRPGGELLVFVAGNAHDALAHEVESRFAEARVLSPHRPSFAAGAVMRIEVDLSI
jgi:16S rRNA (guanine527-N7)-methyltransferase